MNTNDIIRAFIADELLHGRPAGPLGDHEPLIDTGIIDSMGIMILLTFLEEKFSIEVPGDDLIPENFASIAAVTALVERQIAR